MTDTKKQQSASSLQFLQDSCVDGLWPYLPGRAPALEPSIWCAIACRKLPVANLFLKNLISLQNPDGGWSSYEGAERSDWTTGVALLGLRVLGPGTEEHRKAFERGLNFLMDNRTDWYGGLAKALVLMWKGPDYRYPRGWPWTPKTFDWVEPTSYVLLSLRGTSYEKSQPNLASALDDGERFLMNSYCYTGGWDYADRTGPNRQQKKYEAESGPHEPYAYPTYTALALLALQGAGKVHPLTGGLEYLSKPALDNESVLGLSLSAIALNAFDNNIEKQISRLKSRLRKDGSVSDEMMCNALATIAMRLEEDGNPLKAPLPA